MLRLTIRAELLDQVLVVGRRQLMRLLAEFESHYNEHRPHRGINLAAPDRLEADVAPVPRDQISSRKIVGGLITEYHGAAA